MPKESKNQKHFVTEKVPNMWSWTVQTEKMEGSTIINDKQNRNNDIGGEIASQYRKKEKLTSQKKTTNIKYSTAKTYFKNELSLPFEDIWGARYCCTVSWCGQQNDLSTGQLPHAGKIIKKKEVQRKWIQLDARIADRGKLEKVSSLCKELWLYGFDNSCTRFSVWHCI